MTTKSNYPNGFPNGVAISNIPVLNTYAGNVFWVDSVEGSNSHKGTERRPFQTIDYAIGRCTANNGDIILVAPGHVETVISAGGVAVDVDGVSIVGLGQGSDRATFNMTTATSADVRVTASNVTLSNLLFTGGIDALGRLLFVTGDDVSLLNIETRDVVGQTVDAVVINGNARALVSDWVHRGAAAAGADTAMSLVGTSDATVIPSFVDGNFAVAAIESTFPGTNLQVFGRGDYPAYIRTRNAADIIFTAEATTTGRVGPNLNARLQDNAANITEAFAGAAMEFFQPINLVNANGESSMQTNITASTDA